MSAITDLLKTIAKYAPLIASVIPLPGATIIGQIVATAFGGDINKPDELNEMIKKDPQAAIKLAQIQADMKVQLETIAATNLQNQFLADKVKLDAQIEEIKSNAADRASARELAKLSPMPARLSYSILAVFAILIIVILFVPLDTKTNTLNIIFMLYGTIASGFTAVVTFWLGSSASNNKKDDSLAGAYVANTFNSEKLDGIAKVGQQVHTLVNSNMGIQLKMNYVLADRVATLTKEQADLDAAHLAHQLYDEHMKAQAMIDSGKIKQGTT